MLCQNCGKNEVTFRYTQVINGVKKEMALCDNCAKSLGLETLDFNMPINFSSFLGDFIGEETDFLPSFTTPKALQCENCGMTYEEFLNNGKFGCSNCYDVFSERLDKVLKNIQGVDTHIGRKSKKITIKNNKTGEKPFNVSTDEKEAKNEEKEKTLQEQLKQAIKEERYEDAAKIRDEIKQQNENKEE